jgi:NAD(P)-dependent dehydrogenase (short-subunit alcohol dehydrogenase family)
VQYNLASPEDLAQTGKSVEALDRRAITITADVRDAASVSAVVSEAVAELGGLDIVVANAGVTPLSG